MNSSVDQQIAKIQSKKGLLTLFFQKQKEIKMQNYDISINQDQKYIPFRNTKCNKINCIYSQEYMKE